MPAAVYLQTPAICAVPVPSDKTRPRGRAANRQQRKPVRPLLLKPHFLSSGLMERFFRALESLDGHIGSPVSGVCWQARERPADPLDDPAARWRPGVDREIDRHTWKPIVAPKIGGLFGQVMKVRDLRVAGAG